jgi:WXG100 family type VII secretion target
VSLAELGDVVERMAAYEHAVESELGRIDAQVRELAGTWKGAAAASYAIAHAEWSADMARMRSAVRALRSLIAIAQSNYLAAITANRTMWC